MSTETLIPQELEPSQGPRLLPEQELLEVIFGLEQRPISQEKGEQLREALNEVFETLNPRFREVLIRRFGLFDTKKQTLKQVADDWRLTKERIRQLESQGLMRMRHAERTRRLQEYLTLPENSVACAIVNLEGVTYGDLKPLEHAQIENLGNAGYLVMYVRSRKMLWDLKNVRNVFETKSAPFFEHLSNSQVAYLGEVLAFTYSLALTGHFERRKETEEEELRRKEEQPAPIVNSLFTEVDLPPELPKGIVNTPIENLNLDTFTKRELLAHGITSVGDALRQSPYALNVLLRWWYCGSVKEKIWNLMKSRAIEITFKNNLMPQIELQDHFLSKIGWDTIDSLNLPIRVRSALSRSGLQTIGQLIGSMREGLLSYRNIGPISLLEIEQSLRDYLEEITTSPHLP